MNRVPLDLVIANLLSARFAPWAAWLIDRSGCCHESMRSCGHWLLQVGAMSLTWQMARGLDEWSRDLLIWQGCWVQRCAATIWMWFSNKFVNLASRFFISRMSCSNSSWMFYMALIRASISLPYFLTLGNEFGIKNFTWYLVWCMHAWYEKYEMTCYTKKCLTNHDLIHVQ